MRNIQFYTSSRAKITQSIFRMNQTDYSDCINLGPMLSLNLLLCANASSHQQRSSLKTFCFEEEPIQNNAHGRLQRPNFNLKTNWNQLKNKSSKELVSGFWGLQNLCQLLTRVVYFMTPSANRCQLYWFGVVIIYYLCLGRRRISG